ncbi:hypothetical protein FIBSPDRAFT_895389 [Athelia psychrophila]|uniref:G domain-containing protein n=1 Tax=Athelia psychrophila TaxID=1759441 RepID=A0A166EL19_9AGAM|nr:hypothetical protein FIBSPDRAFT_895389 [Fibularhizoctonia sp. CBS 109695]
MSPLPSTEIANGQPNKKPLLLAMSRCNPQPPSYWRNVLGKVSIAVAQKQPSSDRRESQSGTANGVAGVHDINREIICRANQQFVLHDSQGFEGGEAENLATVEQFLKDRGADVDISEQVHAVWLCLPIPTTGSRILETSIEKFLKMKTSRKLGKMPIIAVFTKYDILLTRTRRLGSSDPTKDAAKALEATCIAPLRKLVKDGIPHSTVSNKKGHEETL